MYPNALFSYGGKKARVCLSLWMVNNYDIPPPPQRESTSKNTQHVISEHEDMQLFKSLSYSRA